VTYPAGAEAVDEWQEGPPAYRCIWSRPFNISDDVRCVVIQYADGTIAAEGDDRPLVYIGGSDYELADARALADAIREAADQADRWVTR
jgi:hypothetical protein